MQTIDEYFKKIQSITSNSKIVTIEIESEAIAGIGSTLDEAYEKAVKKYPGKKFYFRRIGPQPAPTYLF